MWLRWRYWIRSFYKISYSVDINSNKSLKCPFWSCAKGKYRNNFPNGKFSFSIGQIKVSHPAGFKLFYFANDFANDFRDLSLPHQPQVTWHATPAYAPLPYTTTTNSPINYYYYYYCHYNTHNNMHIDRYFLPSTILFMVML